MHDQHHFSGATRIAFVFVVALVALARSATAATVTWNDPVSGNWTDAAKWSTGSVPGAADDVVIDADGSYTVTLNALASVRSLALGRSSGTSTQTLSVVAGGTLSPSSTSPVTGWGVLRVAGGTLSGSGALAIDGSLVWTHGTITGSGPLVVNGTLQIGGDPVCCGKDATLDGRTLTNAGTAVWLPGYGHEFYLRNNAVFSNTGIFDIQSDQLMDLGDSSSPQFNNTGTVRKTAGTGTATIDVQFVNAGIIEPSSGTIALTRSSTLGGTVAGTTTLLLSAGSHTFNGLTIGGSGRTRAVGVTVSTTGAGAVVAEGGTLDISGATLTGAGPLTVAGSLIWTHGTITGSGPLVVNGTLQIGGDPVCCGKDATLDGRTLTNAGTAVWLTGYGHEFYLRNNAVFSNAGVFDIQSDQLMDLGDSSSPQFNNTGTVRKTAGTGTATIDVQFVNAGIIEPSSGTIALTRSSTLGGTVAGTTTLLLSAGSHTFNGLTIAGSGTTRATAVTVSTLGAESIVAASGTLELSGTTLAGSGPLTVDGALKWFYGTITGSGSLTVNGSLWIGGDTACCSKDAILDGRILTNAGSAVWLPGYSHEFYLRNNAVFSNVGVFDIQSDQLMDLGDSSSAQFTNSGTVRKSAGVGTTTVDVSFNNSGTMAAEAGILNFTRAFTQIAGSTVLNGGGIASNGTLTFQGGKISGTGLISAHVSTGGETSPGLSPGSISINGNYTQTASSVTRMELAGFNPGTHFDQLQITGSNRTATVAGSLIIELLPGFVPTVGNSFTILNNPNGSVSGTFGSPQFPALPGVAFQVVVGAKTVTLNVVEPPPTATSTVTPTATATHSATATVTRTPTMTATITSSFTPTRTSTITPTEANTATHTSTRTATTTHTFTPTATSTPTPTHTATNSPTRTSTATPSASGTFTPTRTSTPTATVTHTPTGTPTSTATLTRTAAHTHTSTPSATLTTTATQTHSPQPTSTGTLPPSSAPTSTVTPTASFTVTGTATASRTSTEIPTATPTGTMTLTHTQTQTSTPMPSPTHTSTVSPTGTLPGTVTPTTTHTTTPTRSFTATATSTETPTEPPTASVTATDSATPSPPAQPTATDTPIFPPEPTASDTPVLSPTPTASPAPQVCPGDCNGDGRVTIDELVRGVGMALGTQEMRDCTAMDATADNRVTIDELIRAVGMALDGCV